MKIDINDITEHGSISAAIEAKAEASDDIASGVIGPSFACSGPGSGWQCNYDVSDYARRALDDSYGATSYIDSSDGRKATLDEDGQLEWSDESVVEIDLPSVEEALAAPDAASILLDGAAAYGADEEEIENLRSQIEEFSTESE